MPFDFQVIGNHYRGVGLAMNASESGLLIQTFVEMGVGTRINIEALFPNGGNVLRFRTEADIAWKDVYAWDDWEAYQYGLIFTQLSSDDRFKLWHFLRNASKIKQVREIL